MTSGVQLKYNSSENLIVTVDLVSGSCNRVAMRYSGNLHYWSTEHEVYAIDRVKRLKKVCFGKLYPTMDCNKSVTMQKADIDWMKTGTH